MPQYNAILMDPAQIGQGIQSAILAGQQQRKQVETDRALRDYASNMTPENAAAVAPYDPKMSIELQTLEAKRAEAAQKQQQAGQKTVVDHLTRIGQLAQWVETQPDKEAAYQRALVVAKQSGIDISQAPPSYDPNWIASEVDLANAFLMNPEKMTSDMQNAVAITGKPITDPETRKTLAQLQSKTVSMTQGGAVGAMVPGQGFQMVVQPNPGGHVTGEAVGGSPTLQTKQGPDGKTYYGVGGRWFTDPQEAQQAGGVSGNAGGNFRNLERHYSGQ